MEATLTLLQGYQRLLALSNVMLKLAQQGQWDELIGHEMNYVCMVESVARDQDGSALPSLLQAQIRPLLKQVIDNETLLKNMLAVRMNELRTLVGQTTKQQNLTTAYGSFSGNVLFPSDH